MSFVVDCSVATRWLLPDESTPYTDAVFELLGTRDAVVPPLFVSECTNVFLKLARQKRLAPDAAHDAVRAIGELGLEIDRNPVTPERLFRLAHQYGLSACDATYLELALRRGLPLACFDGGLRTAAERAGLTLTA